MQNKFDSLNNYNYLCSLIFNKGLKRPAKVTYMLNQEIASKITSVFVEAMKNGRIPWERPWVNKTGDGGPLFGSLSRNVVTKKPYRGLNAIILDSAPLDVPVWGTFKQWQSIGLFVNKGAKATPTLFWSSLYLHKETKKSISESDFLLLTKEQQANYNRFLKARLDHLFNIEQVNGEKITKLKATWTEFFKNVKGSDDIVEPFRNEAAEKITQKWGIKVKHGGDGAYYAPAMDYIQMPPKAAFKSETGYYETLFHEGIHATGHKSRLGREGIVNFDRFGSDRYSFEELIAEIGSAYVCAALNLEFKVENKTAYLQSWISKLDQNHDWITDASRDALKAANWIMDKLDGEK